MLTFPQHHARTILPPSLRNASPVPVPRRAPYPTPAPIPTPAPYLLRRDISARFGSRLRELRRTHGMTQVELSVHFGIDRTFISDVERGRKSISLRLLEVLAIGFHMSLSDLMRDL